MTTASGLGGAARDVAHLAGSLHVTDHPGTGPAVVAMHGFPDDSRVYDRLISHLAPQRLVTFDWAGYGRSSRRPAQPASQEARQRELAAVLDSLALEQVVLVGHDASGPEAIDFAIGQPDRVRAVILMNTYYGHAPVLRFPEMIALLADPAYRALAEALIGDEQQRLWLLQHTGTQMGIDAADPAGLAAVSVLPQFFGGADAPDALAEIRAWTADLPRALDHQDRRIAAGQLAGLRVPVTVAFGAGDQYLNPDLARHLAGLFGDARLHLIGEARHWPQWDQPAIVAGLIRNATAA